MHIHKLMVERAPKEGYRSGESRGHHPLSDKFIYDAPVYTVHEGQMHEGTDLCTGSPYAEKVNT